MTTLSPRNTSQRADQAVAPPEPALGLPDESLALLVPAPLVRVRRFLCRAGLKVRPWSTSGEALDVLYDVLAAHHDDAEFWLELEQLLKALTEDAHWRHRSFVVDNAVLGTDRMRQLLTEVRDALGRRTHAERADRGPERLGRFGEFARRLPAPAFRVLCLVAGVAVVGCGGETSRAPLGDGDSAGSMTDASGGSTSGSGGATAADMGPTLTPGGTGTGGASAQCTDPPPSLGEIITDCLEPSSYRDRLVECAESLSAAWVKGIEELLVCQTCDEVRRKLECMLEACGDPGLPEDFSVEELMDHCYVSIYVGVPFD